MRNVSPGLPGTGLFLYPLFNLSETSQQEPTGSGELGMEEESVVGTLVVAVDSLFFTDMMAHKPLQPLAPVEGGGA